MQRYLPTLGIKEGEESWYVGVRIRRPLESWRILEPKLRAALIKFMHSESRTQTTLCITPHLDVNLTRAGRVYPSFYQMGIGLDKDSGGFVISEIYKKLQLCISDKDNKVAPYRHRYPEWWLVLPNHIGRCMDTEDQRQFNDLPPIKHTWHKVILLNTHNPTDAFELT